MGPTANVWGNALLIAAAGAALILAAAFGRTFGASPAGRKLLSWSPLAVALVVVAYLGVALIRMPGAPSDPCIYSNAHPSDCRDGGAPSSRGSTG